MKQDRSLKIVVLLVGVAALIGLIHVGARVLRFLYYPQQTTWCLDGMYDAQNNLYLYFTDCTPAHSFWAALRSYTPGSVYEVIVQHAGSLALLAGMTAIASLLYGFLHRSSDEEETASSQQCVHAAEEAESDTEPYCRNSQCSCVGHENEEFTAAWIPRQG